jgi:hypothetical protein
MTVRKWRTLTALGCCLASFLRPCGAAADQPANRIALRAGFSYSFPGEGGDAAEPSGQFLRLGADWNYAIAPYFPLHPALTLVVEGGTGTIAGKRLSMITVAPEVSLELSVAHAVPIYIYPRAGVTFQWSDADNCPSACPLSGLQGGQTGLRMGIGARYVSGSYQFSFEPITLDFLARTFLSMSAGAGIAF